MGGERQVFATWQSDAGSEFCGVHPSNCNLLELIGMFIENYWRCISRSTNPAVGNGFRKKSGKRLEKFNVER